MRTCSFRVAQRDRLRAAGTRTTSEVYVQIRAKTTRRFLLEAAAALFDERGYAGTSISDISAHSGRTSGAIYFHFASKEKLALAIVEEHFATWPQLINRYRKPGLPALEKLF